MTPIRSGLCLWPVCGRSYRNGVSKVQRIIDDKEYRDEMVDFNFEIGKAFFSYSVLRRKLRALVTNFTGQENL